MKTEHYAVALEQVDRPYYRKPIAAHAFELDQHADRILCGRADVSYSVALNRRWREPQPVERCQECVELIAVPATS